MKKSYKKVYALYLSVAFFFVFFSFGISHAQASTLIVAGIASTGEIDTSAWNTATGNSAGFGYFFECGNYPTINSHLGDNSGGFFTFSSLNGLDLDGYLGTCPTGDIWVEFTSASQLWYSQWNKSGGTWGTGAGTPADTSTRFISFTVNQSAGTVLATGYWTASATSSQSQELRFWQISPVLGQESYASRIATTTGNFSFTFPYVDSSFQISATSTSYTLGSGTTFHGEIYQLYDGFNPFNNTGTPPLLLTSTSTQITATSTVTVDSSNSRSLSGLPEPSDCSLSAITGCIKNAAVWLFYPSSESVDSFKGLSDTLSGKFPFAYAYGINTMRLELFNAAQTSTTTISLNFKIIPGHATSTLTLLSPTLLSNVPYSSTVKTILGWILWLLGIEYIYYRVLRSHDPNTPS